MAQGGRGSNTPCGVSNSRLWRHHRMPTFFFNLALTCSWECQNEIEKCSPQLRTAQFAFLNFTFSWNGLNLLCVTKRNHSHRSNSLRWTFLIWNVKRSVIFQTEIPFQRKSCFFGSRNSGVLNIFSVKVCHDKDLHDSLCGGNRCMRCSYNQRTPFARQRCITHQIFFIFVL